MLQLVASGLTNKQVGDELGIGVMAKPHRPCLLADLVTIVATLVPVPAGCPLRGKAGISPRGIRDRPPLDRRAVHAGPIPLYRFRCAEAVPKLLGCCDAHGQARSLRRSPLL